MTNSADISTCPLCAPRPDHTAQWMKIATLAVSTLYLDRNQTYRGHCQLIYDASHVAGIEHLSAPQFAVAAQDLHRAAQAIRRACEPDHMNHVSLGNVVPHLHWHLVPRYQTDPRWGRPIYTTDPADMPVTRLDEGEYQAIAARIAAALPAAEPSA